MSNESQADFCRDDGVHHYSLLIAFHSMYFGLRKCDG
jgi:hypothetical protein